MKAITLHQPWASLVALGLKDIETRSWSTSYRGPIAIHAGRTIDWDAYEFIYNALDAYGAADELPTGAVIATATLSDCVLMTREWIEAIDPDERECGFYAPGRYGWILTGVQPITPVPQRGYQGLWDWDRGAA